MYTYQDLLELGEERKTDALMDFVLRAINDHKSGELYKTAKTAKEYDRHRNVTIVEYQRLLYTITGAAVPDNYSANYKLASKFFHRFVTQQNQFLLGNGVQWQNEETSEALGGDFDIKLQKAGQSALVCGISFGFWNLDHVDVFEVTEFVPLWDEVNGSLRAGVRFWQIQSDKPLRATLFEEDGYTEFIWVDGEGSVLKKKTSYVIYKRETEAGDAEIYDMRNYPTFPIVPLWGNPQHQSELVGIREQIDAYDLIKSNFCNTVDEASIVYWTIQNAGGMDDIDIVKFVERMKTIHAAAVEENGARAEPTTVEAPSSSREVLLDRIRRDLYDDYMALDTRTIANGAVNTTQIRAAYEPMNSKADEYEYCVHEFVKGLLDVAGINDSPTFTRSMMINVSEEIQVVLQSAQYLQEDYVTEKILTILGDGDRVEQMLLERDADELRRFSQVTSEDVEVDDRA